MALLATVHFGRDFVNAFWDGEQMVFGDGDGVLFGRFTASLDVIAHELAHGLIDYTSPLIYQGQSGALNESISDVFGAMVSQRTAGHTAAEADWLIGADLLLPGVAGVALRSMIDPGTAYDDPRLGRDPQPGHMDDYVDTIDDNGGVHINSGIPNRAFALAAIEAGGYSWDTVGQVWFDVLGTDLPTRCTFVEFATRTIAVARALFGDGPVVDAVRHGWHQVGVLIDDRASGDDRGELEPPTGDPVDLPAPDPGGPVPAPDDELTLRRSGGFGGFTAERTVQLGELRDDDTRQWQHLLSCRVLEAIGPTSIPDAFVYRVVCSPVDVDVSVPEPSLPDDVRSLFRRTLDPDD